MGYWKKNTMVRTTKHIYLGDLLEAVPEVDEDAVWQTVNDSDISFGNNADTMVNKDDLSRIIGDEEGSEKILALVPEGILISLGR